MASGGPWNLRGLRPEARSAAREAARRSGLSVGEWLNSLIPRAEHPEDDEAWWSEAADREGDRRPRRRFFEEGRGRQRHHRKPRRDRDRGFDDERAQEFERQEFDRQEFDRQEFNRQEFDPQEFDRTFDRPPPRRRHFRHEHWEQGPSRRFDDRRRDDGYREDEWPVEPPRDDRRRHDYGDEDRAPPPPGFRADHRDPARHRDEPDRRRAREPEDQYLLNLRHEGRAQGRARAASAPSRPPRYEPREDDGHSVQRGSPPRPERNHADPYRDPAAAEHGGWERYVPAAILLPEEEPDHETLVDRAVAEITARQRALDSEAPPPPAARPRMPEPAPPAAPLQASPEQVRSNWKNWEWRGPDPLPKSAPEPAIDLGNFEQQLRQITAKIEALRPPGELETALTPLRAELAEIGRSLTEALPQRAVESLETEVKALAERIDHTRQNGGATGALADVERGLIEVREALRALTPAEGLVGFGETVKALHEKVDAIASKNGPAVVQQLEIAVGTLRGIAAHVASSDALAKVADDMRALGAKIDLVAAGAATMPALSALENRIDALASALNASTDAGQAVPRELERLVAGLIEKLEGLQLTHTDHSALTHLEDRIAALVKRLDASDMRLGLLEGVERGLADLLVYIEQLRGAGAAIGGVKAAAAAEAPAEVKQTERRGQGATPDTHDDAYGAAIRAADRPTATQSDIGADRGRVASAEIAAAVDAPPLAPAPPAPAAAPQRSAVPAVLPAVEAVPDLEPGSQRLVAAAAARTPINPNLPPDHPLEPSPAGRNGQTPSAAERIAASEAVAGSKPPVIADPGGGKADFIAAARRAARAAAAGTAEEKSRGTSAGPGNPVARKKLADRLRPVIVAAAVFAIVVGGFRIVSHMFEDGSAIPAQQPAVAPHLQSVPPGVTEPPQPQALPVPTQSEPRAEPPHAEAEPLPPAMLPVPNAAASQPLTLPVPPDADAAQTSHAPPADAPPAAPSGQEPHNESHNVVPPPAGVTTGVGAPQDITGSLPRANDGPPSGAHARPATVMPKDLLPLGIGGPALRLAALAGDPAAAYEVAARYAEGRGVPASNEEAARWFEIAAKKGLAPAQFRLGGLYEKGLGVKKDIAAARDLYRAAADQGHGKAMHNLAVLYAEGIDGKPDYATAAQWFRKAADHGITDSQYNLAVLYARGVGVEQNFAEAYKWFFLAAKEGDRDAAQKRDDVAPRLDQSALATARAAAEKWTPLAQPAEATITRSGWDAPTASAAPGAPSPKPKPRPAKAATGGDATKAATGGDASKVN
jgi:localization factor PodJL